MGGLPGLLPVAEGEVAIPYQPTYAPVGRPRTKDWQDDLARELQRADQLDREAARHRAKVAACLAAQLAGSKTRASLADELGWTVNDIRRALRGLPITPSTQVETPARSEESST